MIPLLCGPRKNQIHGDGKRMPVPGAGRGEGTEHLKGTVFGTAKIWTWWRRLRSHVTVFNVLELHTQQG